MSRAAQLDCQHERSCALVLTLFLFQKGQGFFPPLPIAALFPRSWRWAYASLASWDASIRLGNFAAWMNGLIFFSPRLSAGRLTPCGLECFDMAWKFLQRKRPAGFSNHAGRRLLKNALFFFENAAFFE